jgi:mRNA degradation ribonuclease J1/J2
MKKAKRNRLHAKFARLQRHLEIGADLQKPRRIRTRSVRYAAALGEQLGLIERPHACSWCRRRARLERHHWDYDEPLNVTFLCTDCHTIADNMVSHANSA